MPLPSDHRECGSVKSPAAGFFSGLRVGCVAGGGGGGEQGRRAPDTVFVKYHPSLSLTDVNQTTELPWIQCGFSSSSGVLSPFLTGRMFVRPNILRTLRRTMIRFLIELLVRRIWFGQSKLYFTVLNWLVMRCKLRPELAADAHWADSMIVNVG